MPTGARSRVPHLLWLVPALYFAGLIARGQLSAYLDRPEERLLRPLRDLPPPDEIPVPRGFELVRTVRARLTAYEPSHRSCGRFADGLTAIGRDANVADGVAAAPEAIPYGSLVFIPGIGFRMVDDTGAAMQRAWQRSRLVHLDVRMGTVDEALAFGRHEKVPVYVFTRSSARPAPER